MTLLNIARAASAFLLVGALSACVDVSMELEVVDENNGIGKTIMVMDREFYDMSQAQGESDFCEDDGEFTLTETEATCVTSEKGSYAELFEGSDQGEPTPTVTSAGPGLVRVSYPTASMMEELGDDASDPEAMAMMEQFFAGHNITLAVSGGEIVDTNMTLSDDGQYASVVIPFLDLFSSEVTLPKESYAVVKLN